MEVIGEKVPIKKLDTGAPHGVKHVGFKGQIIVIRPKEAIAPVPTAVDVVGRVLKLDTGCSRQSLIDLDTFADFSLQM